MVSWAGSPVNQSQAHAVVTRWEDIVQHLSPPGVVWAWTESPLAHSTKYRLKDEGLIKRAPDGDRWETTEGLWLFVIDRADPDEDVGRESQGQEMIAQVREGRDTDPLQPGSTTSSPAQQTTLTGDDVEISNDGEKIETNQAKSDNDSDDSGPATGQLRLDLFDIGQTTIDEWVGVLGARDATA